MDVWETFAEGIKTLKKMKEFIDTANKAYDIKHKTLALYFQP
jgi:dTDP-4-dehydrorhamnose 3,5-epimerase-like enzyme